MSERKEFVRLASKAEVPFRELCQRFGISPKSGYKWFNRYRQDGDEGLKDQSKRPHVSPRKSTKAVEKRIIEIRLQQRAWGARKIKARLERLGFDSLPSTSTINDILRRNGLILPEASEKSKSHKRFERENPNQLWQMDYKGHYPTAGGECHPLTILDDHSRYSIMVKACKNEQGTTVQNCLIEAFEQYGLPDKILTDNAPPWGFPMIRRRYTALGVWLLRLGVDICHGRPLHPQTQGKIERFHRSLKAEVISNRAWKNLNECQEAFDQWRYIYNYERPHEALGMKVPGDRYLPSLRKMPSTILPIEYDSDCEIRKVKPSGSISFKNQYYYVGSPFGGLSVAIKPTLKDGYYDVYFLWKKLGTINLHLLPQTEYQEISIYGKEEIKL